MVIYICIRNTHVVAKFSDTASKVTKLMPFQKRVSCIVITWSNQFEINFLASSPIYERLNDKIRFLTKPHVLL